MRKSVTESDSTGNTATYTWTYDALNRLTKEVYDDLVDTNDFTHTYTFDLIGNRLEKQVAGSDPNTTYTYDSDTDELTQEITGANSITYTYNDNGSLVYVDKDDDPNLTYTYGYHNRQISADDETNTVTYKYNAAGIRVQAAITAGSTSEYLMDPYNHTGYAQVFKTKVDADANSMLYILGHDVIAQVSGSEDPNYFVYDGHGSVRHLANNSGTITESYDYDAYGNRLDSTAASTNLLYAGEMYDSTAAQYYLRARWYNPANGRFNRMDPFSGNNQDPQSLHKYLYGNGNPIMNIDPSGMFGIASVSVSMSISIGLNLTYSLAVLGTGTWGMEQYFRARTNFNIRNQPKVENNATIIVHGINAHPYGWSSSFQESLKSRASNQDYYEFTWSGFALTGGKGINSIAGDVATDSLVDAIGAVRRKGYTNINIVAHSWGTVISKNAMKEGVGNINTWVTMGSPLTKTTNRPPDLTYWLNMWCKYDPVVYAGPTQITGLGWGYLFNNTGVNEQFPVDDVVQELSVKNHEAYWTDTSALGRIGGRLSGQ